MGGKQKTQCIVGPIDKSTRSGRDPFAPPGFSGNRWLKFGCDGPIPAKHRVKVEEAVNLAYKLNDNTQFRQGFDKLLKALAPGTPLSYLDALNMTVLNLADTSANSLIQQEMKDALEAKKQDPNYQIEGGFTVLSMPGQVWIRQFALKGWNVKHLAGLISHEATHIAGAPGDLGTELLLATLDLVGYPRPE